MKRQPRLLVELPSWIEAIAPAGVYAGESDRMGVAIALARQNVTTGHGGPFGAAVFQLETGLLVAAGVNLVEPMNNSVLHAEVVAIMLAEMNLASCTLDNEDGIRHELVTSCEPCAMCLGAVHWSGVHRLVTGATREDVEAIQFDEGPVFPESYAYLEQRGLEVRREVLRPEAVEILKMYARMNGKIY